MYVYNENVIYINRSEREREEKERDKERESKHIEAYINNNVHICSPYMRRRRVSTPKASFAPHFFPSFVRLPLALFVFFFSFLLYVQI